MADYHAVLKRAIDALPESTGAARRAVYQRARSAIINQLKSYDPPLSPSDITTEQLRLEEAIRKVEADAARASLGLGPQSRPAPEAKPAAPAAPAAPAKPEAEAAAPASPQKPPMPEPAKPATVQPSPAVPPAAKAPAPAAEPPASTAEKILATPANRPAPTADLAPPPKTADSKPAEAPKPLDDTTPTSPVFPSVTATRPEGADADTPMSEYVGEMRPSRLPMIAAIVFALLVFVGLLSLAYSQRDAILALMSGSDGMTETSVRDETPAEQAPPAETAGTEEGKFSGRLLSDDGSPAAPDARAVTTTRVVPPADEAGVTVAPQSAPEAPSATPPAEEAPAPEAAAPTAPQSALDAAPDAAPPVAQRSILYEEGSEGAADSSGGSAEQGRVVWSTGSEVPADGGTPYTVIKANVVIPGRDVTVDLVIRPNRDTTLPASHLIELQFTLPPDFSGKAVSSVPGLIMKTTEEARGDALIGASVRLSDGIFWVALSSIETERNRNEALLRDRGWIDIPVLYESGKRAILTLEKGGPGERAVQAALAEWAQG